MFKKKKNNRAKQTNDRCRANQLPGFCMMATLAFNELTLTATKHRPLKCFYIIRIKIFYISLKVPFSKIPYSSVKINGKRLRKNVSLRKFLRTLNFSL